MVKPYLVRVITGANMSRTLPALVAERMTDGIAVIALAAVGVTTYASEHTQLIYATIGIIGLGIAALSIEPLMRGIIRVIGALPVVGRVAERLDEAYTSTRAVLAPGPLVFTIFLSLIAWFAECVGCWVVFRGLGVDASLDVSTFLYAFGTVFGAPSPGGLGMADVALVEGALQLINGITEGQAVAGALLVRVATLWFGVVLGAIALLRMERVIEAARAEQVVE